MIDVEPLIHDELDRLSPWEATTADWPDVLTRVGAQDEGSTPRRFVRTRNRLFAAGVVAVTVAVFAALAPGWLGSGSSSVLGRALAAVSGGPVLHAVLEIDQANLVVGPSTKPTYQTLNLKTGATSTVLNRREIWFDKKRGLLHETTTVGGAVQYDALQTPTVTRNNLSRKPLPGGAVLDPGLNDALAGYRAALQTGKARVAGRAIMNGFPVLWIRFPSVQKGVYEEVAVDPTTYQARFMREICSGCTAPPPTYTIITLEGIGHRAADFSAPHWSSPSFGRYANSEIRAIPITDAPQLLHTPGLWSGRSISGVRLSLTQYLNSSLHDALPIRRSNTVGRGYAIRLLYGVQVLANGGYRTKPGKPSVGITETKTFAYAGNFGRGRTALTVAQAPVPNWPNVALSHIDNSLVVVQTKRDHLYIEIDASTRALAIEAARTLRMTP